MKIPFWNPIPDEFKPRDFLGKDENLTPGQKKVIEHMDIMEQKADLALSLLAIVVKVLALIVLFLALTQWDTIGRILRRSAGQEAPPSAHTKAPE